MSKDWQAVADAINTRMEQLDMTQAELAKRSGVAVATLRQIQHAVPKRRSPRTLADISEALRWPPTHLEKVADGEQPTNGDQDRIGQLEAAVADLQQRVDVIERHARPGATPPAG